MLELTSLWQIQTRYYRISLIQDLFGVWMLVRQWGGLVGKHFREITNSFSDYNSALLEYSNAQKRRKGRGYTKIKI